MILRLSIMQSVLDPGVEYFSDVYEYVKGVDAIVIATDWPDYARLDRVKKPVREPLIIDCRSISYRELVMRRGFRYLGIGLPLAQGV